MDTRNGSIRTTLSLGDVIMVQAGNQITVDGELLSGSKIELDESALTGESDLSAQKLAATRSSRGSVCVTGAGMMRATAVGESSFANKLTKNARQFELKRTPLQRNVNRLLRLILLVILNLVLLAVLSSNRFGCFITGLAAGPLGHLQPGVSWSAHHDHTQLFLGCD